MSPIGRVFIVLNLLLAATFLGFSGTYLQRQHSWKEKYDGEVKAHAATTEKANQERLKLENERNTFENAKTTAETKLGAAETALANAEAENKRLHGQLASMEGDVKQINSQLAAANTQAQAAFDQSKEAYKMAMNDQKTKDDAVRAKDTAEAENRTLKTTIASLEDTVKNKDLDIAGLHKERNELQLLVKVAEQNGFVPGLAAPTLNGTVSHVANGRLCTISITDNPGKVDIADQLNKRSFSFAIYDATGYKGEAVATQYDPKENAVFCNLLLVKGTIKEGDKASTKTP